MKRGRLPLTALRSFEAAGRHLSISRAAQELFVSQAAVSRQVRDLEALVGRPLFERHHRRVALTEAGRGLLEQLTLSFDDIDRRLTEVIATPAQQVLKVSAEPSFGRGWLVPRLNRFREERPDIDVAVDVDARLVEFRRDEAELAIRHSLARSSWPRAQAERLVDVQMLPVMSPALLASGPPLNQPADLGRLTLLHEENRKGWALWFSAAGTADKVPERGPIFPDASLATQAAMLGHGVALGDTFLNADDLCARRLVSPFPKAVPYGAYWLVAPDLAALSAPANAFAEWLRRQIRIDAQGMHQAAQNVDCQKAATWPAR